MGSSCAFAIQVSPLVKVDELKSLSHVRLFATPRAIQSMEFSGPEYRSGQPFSLVRDLPNPGSNPGLLHSGQILYQLSHREAQEYWSGLPIPSPADLPDPGIETESPALQADSLPTKLSGKPSGEVSVQIFGPLFFIVFFSSFKSCLYIPRKSSLSSG